MRVQGMCVQCACLRLMYSPCWEMLRYHECEPRFTQSFSETNWRHFSVQFLENKTTFDICYILAHL